VDNLADAITIAAREKITRIHCRGSLTLTGAATGYLFEAYFPDDCTIDVNGQDVDGSSFDKTTITGAIVGSIHATDCAISDGVTGLAGGLTGCGIDGTVTCAGIGSQVFLRDCVGSGALGATIDMVGGGRVFGGTGFTGTWTLKNIVDGPPPGVAQLEFLSGLCKLDATCTGGIILLYGEASFVNLGAASTIYNNLFNAANVDAQLAASHGSGDWTAAAVSTPSAADIADAVWDEAVADHQTPATAGHRLELLKKIMTNKLTLSETGDGELVLYDDDDTTPLLTWTQRDKSGDPISIPAEAPAQRGRGA
jgi:hypothetical protein